MVDHFFKWIWRLNGLIVLVAALMVVFNLSFMFLQDVFRDEPQVVVTGIAEDPEGMENWVLGRPRHIDGSDITIIRLVSENSEVDLQNFNMYSSSGFVGGYEQVSKNILFVNRSTGEMRWLFEGVGQIISTVNELPDRRQSPHRIDDVTEIMLYEVTMKDTDGDQMITNQDSPVLAYSLLDGSGFQVLLEGYEKLISTTYEDNKMLSVMYQKSGSAYLAQISLSPEVKINRVGFPKLQ